MRNRLPAAATVLCILALASRAWSLDFPGPAPGPATAKIQDGKLILENGVLSAVWQLPDERNTVRLVKIVDRISGQNYAAGTPSPFEIAFETPGRAAVGTFKSDGIATLEKLTPRARALRAADRAAGWKAKVPLVSQDGQVRMDWYVVFRDGSNYVQQELVIHAADKDLPTKEVALRVPVGEGARVEGSVDGSPVVSGDLFIGCEHPMSTARVEGGVARCSVGTFGPVRAGQPCARSWVIGVAPPGQMRRAFLYYVERERPRPYQPFLHYNSWYDIAWGDRKFNEAQSLEAIEIFGEELCEKRGVTLQSFVFDDGWDDNKTLWQFHDGFPKGFTPLRDKARLYKSAVGTWLSPFGGYGEAREQRLLYGREQGYETNDSGFSMVGPNYYARFKAICEEMIRNYGVKFFKFDGMGAGLEAGARGSRKYLGDVEALMRLTDELRDIAPDIYISATTGTWPSPYFLWHADNIWRGAGDMGFSGEGSKRQQWINYRDTWTYRNIVQKGPLYPLNALMTQGIVQANHGMAAELGNDDAEMANEIWSFFGSGTSLQELYIAPALLNENNWDTLAHASKWAKENAAVLADTHWVGGDPGDTMVYGWASWTPSKAILVLRNPSPQKSAITLDIGKALELPDGAPGTFSMSTPRMDQRELPESTIVAGTPRQFEIDAFEVLVFELIPE